MWENEIISSGLSFRTGSLLKATWCCQFFHSRILILFLFAWSGALICFCLGSFSAQNRLWGKTRYSNNNPVGEGKIVQTAPECYTYFQIFFSPWCMGFIHFLAWMLQRLLGWAPLQLSVVKNIQAVNRCILHHLSYVVDRTPFQATVHAEAGIPGCQGLDSTRASPLSSLPFINREFLSKIGILQIYSF